MQIFLEVIILILVYAIFVGVKCALMVPLAKLRPASFAVLKRNFIGYFSNPTGYVFICLFVFLSSLSAFWPYEFFNRNLANLEQLNEFLPYVMLVFIPAITMSIWAEERRQGTDELLLTLPADDFDIVFGKYLAAAAIFTVSLLFSTFCNHTALAWLSLGELDTGMLIATYAGYWVVGLAMIAIGMVASFLTSNLTVGFVLGALLNAPMVFSIQADTVVAGRGARAVAYWSIGSQFSDSFGRGVLSLSALIYFCMIIVVGLYISMVLIGRRHWVGGKDGSNLLPHYLARSVAIFIGGLGATAFFANWDFVRVDITKGQVASLSPATKQILSNLDSKYPIQVDAYLSAEVPEEYVQTKYDLVSMLKELRASGKVNVVIHELEPFSEEASLAEDRYKITARTVQVRTKGTFKAEQVILGVACRCGLQKVVVPFFDRGIPVEYELIRSISTVVREKKLKLGVVKTAVNLNGGFDMSTGRFQQIPRQAILSELDKQYDIEEVNLAQPLPKGNFDVLLVVQPSSMGPVEMDNLVKAIQAGQPAAIFEDPRPGFMPGPATGEPRPSPGGMMMRRQQPQPKGDIRKLWDALGIKSPGKRDLRSGGMNPDIVFQYYVPYRKLRGQRVRWGLDQWIFCSNVFAEAGNNAINQEDEVTKGLGEVLLTYAGSIEKNRDGIDLEFTPLLSTAGNGFSGSIPYDRMMQNQTGDAKESRGNHTRRKSALHLAARIRGEIDEDDIADANKKDKKDSKDKKKKADPSSGPNEVHVIYVADIDVLSEAFVRLRASRSDGEMIRWKFQNVSFVLNVIDSLAGESRYIPIRSRRTIHHTLQLVEQNITALQENAESQRKEYVEERKKQEAKLDKDNEEIDAQFQKDLQQLRDENAPVEKIVALTQKYQVDRALRQQRTSLTQAQLKRDTKKKIERNERDTELRIEQIQSRFKVASVFVPLILPILLALIVYAQRRLREREGVSRARLV